ncbi:hypothetical protein IMZ48_49880 [Candidatus Bathyarchaeota archaeon]|nr:hypothetical protein [Candidatus Bathyarchaeota archaeon]
MAQVGQNGKRKRDDGDDDECGTPTRKRNNSKNGGDGGNYTMARMQINNEREGGGGGGGGKSANHADMASRKAPGKLEARQLPTPSPKTKSRARNGTQPKRPSPQKTQKGQSAQPAKKRGRPRKLLPREDPETDHEDPAGNGTQPKRPSPQKTQKSQRAVPTRKRGRLLKLPPQGDPETDHEDPEVHHSHSTSFLDFKRFSNAQEEGYSYLRRTVSKRYGRGLGPDRDAYAEGCLSKKSCEALGPYPEAVRTRLHEYPGVKERWSLAHSFYLKDTRDIVPWKPESIKGMFCAGAEDSRFKAPRGSR